MKGKEKNYKQYIFKVKIHFSLLKSAEMLSAVTKNGQFKEIFAHTKNTLFARWSKNSNIADVNVFKSEWVKNMQDYTQK